MTESILLEKTTRLLIQERERKDIVIGAPHHTPGGIGEMPCPDHTDGDENAGLIANKIADILNLSSIIACNYHIDSNKSLGTDYSLQIIKWKPTYLIEIHGHGAKKKERGKKRECNDECIEISSGNKARSDDSERFAEVLKSKFQNYEDLKDYNVYGEFERLHFQASSSATIATDLWLPFHIELPPSLRKDKENDNKPPKFIDDFVKCLTDTIKEICGENS